MDRLTEVKMKYTDGTPVPDGHAVLPDQRIDTFVITVSSLCGVSSHDMKDVIQKLHKVMEIEHTTRTVVVKK